MLQIHAGDALGEAVSGGAAGGGKRKHSPVATDDVALIKVARFAAGADGAKGVDATEDSASGRKARK